MFFDIGVCLLPGKMFSRAAFCDVCCCICVVRVAQNCGEILCNATNLCKLLVNLQKGIDLCKIVWYNRIGQKMMIWDFAYIIGEMFSIGYTFGRCE